MRRPRLGLASANIIASTALFVALGGTGWAGQVLGAGSVGTRQLAHDSVTAAKIAPGAVTKSKFAGGAVGAGAIARGAVGNGAIALGAVTSDRMAPGVLGGVAPGKITVVAGPVVALPAFQFGQLVSVSCPVGDRAVAGGWYAGYYAVPISEGPTADDTGWQVSFQATLNTQVNVTAICLAP
jgi:hypothetical protein